MSILKAIILGIIQGLTEFLPISSSGHLVLFSKIFKIENNFILFSVFLHLATLFAVLIYFRKQVFDILKKPFSPLTYKLVLATLPAIITALLFSDFIEKMFEGFLLPFCFVFTAVLLVVAQIFSKSNKPHKKLDYKGAIFMGLMQSVALVPGISRSGSTIAGGLIAGYDKQESANFSFLMSVPVILASLVYETMKLIKNPIVSISIFSTIIGSVFAFVTGLLSIYLMLKAIKKVKLHYFSIYLFAVALFSLIFI